jgi:lactate permease
VLEYATVADASLRWAQVYDPLRSEVLSTLLAALPVVVLLGALGLLRARAHVAALAGLGVALVVALGPFGMPASAGLAAAAFGAAYGLFPIGWIVLNLIFLYDLCVARGHFAVLRTSLARLSPDPRIQVIGIAFCLGAFFEGAAGFGTPVAVTAALLISLGFTPLAASCLSLIANTAPVAFGALGTPIMALSAVTGLDLHALSSMVGRQLPPFAIIVPFWVVAALAGLKGMWGVWPAALVAGGAFALPQYLISNFHGPWLVDVVSALVSMAALALLLRFWRPHDTWALSGTATAGAPGAQLTRREAWEAWRPWLLLSACVFAWGLPSVKAFLNGLSAPRLSVPYLDGLVERVPPVVAAARAEEAVFTLSWLSATGTGILFAALLAGLLMGCSPGEMARAYAGALRRVRFSLLTIAAMLALGYLSRYSGMDATLGLALAGTGAFYPFFGTLLGWLGVALTGSDTASNVLFGSLQRITAEQTGLSPVLMAAANSSGGVMGKMVDAQSIVVASVATGAHGAEGEILRRVFWHSLALAALVGLLVWLQATVWPFTLLVVG